jgi:hypothetical protein
VLNAWIQVQLANGAAAQEGNAKLAGVGSLGGLNQMAYSLFLFMRDIAAGDLVGWINQQLATVASPALCLS